MININNYKINSKNPVNGLEYLGSKASAEGIVLLKNDGVLPIKNKTISLFGRTQTTYYKSGTGSGGLVNVLRSLSLRSALSENPLVNLNEELVKEYDNWIKNNPFDAGDGSWASEPWCQVEMPVSDELAKKCAKNSDVAVVILARTAGEDRDNHAGKGSYLLSDEEENMLATISKNFKKVVVMLNVGNIIDMSFMDRYKIDSVMYIWHGGSAGARAASDVLTGVVTPSGKLVNTIANTIDDYPSTKNFGDEFLNYYQEDIYVGYRYFNTFNQKVIKYPFGFGLSYTTFSQKAEATKKANCINIKVTVKNTGKVNGKEVVQIYCNPSNGKLGRPRVELVAFSKTKDLKPGESQVINLNVDINKLATFDDFGVSGFKNAYVLESGNYNFYCANDSINLNDVIYSLNIEKDTLVQQLNPLMSPVRDFEIMSSEIVNGEYKLVYKKAPKRDYDVETKYISLKPQTLEQTENFLTLEDVYNKKCTMDQFIATLNDELLAAICRGEGMSSPKVTPGTAGCFGGVHEDLLKRKVPVMCAADGPSGIRMDSGQIATSLPNGISLASSFNFDLVCDLYKVVGKELRSYDVDVLLGPGMNIHRNPLNGRNFEYFSEDPLITGMFAAAFTYGVQSTGGSGTLKHYACNNQEFSRNFVDSAVSQRALREIYLKGFEIAIKMAKSRAIMTSYNAINGTWSASNFELNYELARKEWGFEGIIMSDWWPNLSDDQGTPSKQNTKAMIRSTNDLFMVVRDSKENTNEDNTLVSLKNGDLDRSYAQLCAKNICTYALTSKTFYKMLNKELKDEDYKMDNWFIVDKDEDTVELLKSVEINGKKLENFDPIINEYYIDDNIDTIKVSNGTVINNNKAALVVLNNNIYYFISGKFVKDKEELNLENANLDKVVIVDKEVKLNLNDYALKSSKLVVDNNTIRETIKTEFITYAVNVKEETNYEVKFDYICDSKALAQIPFSIYINQSNVQTITVGVTDKVMSVSGVIPIKKGNRLMTFKFAAHGLVIKGVTITKK